MRTCGLYLFTYTRFSRQPVSSGVLGWQLSAPAVTPKCHRFCPPSPKRCLCTHLFRSTRRGLGPRSSRIRGFARWHVANLTRDEMQTVRKTPISSRCALAHHLRRRWPDFLREAGTAHATAAILRVGHATGACMFQSRAGMAGFMRGAARVSLTADACAACAAIVETRPQGRPSLPFFTT